jgi:calcineurin B family protein 1
MRGKIVCFLFSVAFKMYDLDNDDKISKDELLAILHMMVGANIRWVTD